MLNSWQDYPFRPETFYETPGLEAEMVNLLARDINDKYHLSMSTEGMVKLFR